MNKRIAELRKQAILLNTEANELEAREIKDDELFIVVENIQDGRPRASGPFTWEVASRAVVSGNNRYICDYGGLLP